MQLYSRFCLHASVSYHNSLFSRCFIRFRDPATGEDVALVPIAIELAAHPNTYKEPTPTTPPKSGTVFSRSKLLNSGQKNMWDLAKLVFRSLDVGVHQLISHWLRCHAAIEPFLIALKRCVSTAHPVSHQGCNGALMEWLVAAAFL